jgi:hypothetical protein
MVQLDTGSSNLWVPSADSVECKHHPVICAATGTYSSNKSSTYQLMNADFYAQYGTPEIDIGDYVSDTVHINGVSLPNVTFGLALKESGAGDSFGILGVGYTMNEGGYRFNHNTSLVYPTVLDQLVTSGTIDRHVFSLFLNDQAAGKGSILFGGVDSGKYTGALTALPIIQNNYNGTMVYLEYRVALTSISINSETGNSVLTSSNFSNAALLDSGTTSMDLPMSVAQAIYSGLGAKNLSSTTYVTSCVYMNSNSTLSFQFGGPTGPTVNVSFAEILVPTGTNFGDGDEICEIRIAGVPDATSQADGIVLGDAFLRAAYLVYDLDNNEIAIAQAKLNSTESNVQAISSGEAVPGVSSTAMATAPVVTYTSPFAAAASTTSAAGSSGTASAASSASTQLPSIPQSAGSPTFSLGVTPSASGSSGAGVSAMSSGSAGGAGASASSSGSASGAGASASSSGSASGAGATASASMGKMTWGVLVSLAMSFFAGMLIL